MRFRFPFVCLIRTTIVHSEIVFENGILWFLGILCLKHASIAPTAISLRVSEIFRFQRNRADFASHGFKQNMPRPQRCNSKTNFLAFQHFLNVALTHLYINIAEKRILANSGYQKDGLYDPPMERFKKFSTDSKILFTAS